MNNTFIPVYIHIHIQTAKDRTLCVYYREYKCESTVDVNFIVNVNVDVQNVAFHFYLFEHHH